MADEITENKTLITDEILAEMEKVSQLEKGMKFLNARQGSVEKSVSLLKTMVGKDATDQEQSNNVISEDGEETEGDEKNVLKDNKLKPHLTDVEKKRYENIGVEFIKGSQKVFDEIKKAEVLKGKMSTRTASALKKKESENKSKTEKKTGSLMSSFLKLGLAITALYVLIENFGDKFTQAFPDLSDKISIGTDVIKNVFKNIGDFLNKHIGSHLRAAFGNIRTGIDTFFDKTLPNAVYKSGLVIVKAFGGKITKEMENLDTVTTNTVADSIESGKQRAEQNYVTLQDVFSSRQEIDKAKSQIALDSFRQMGEVGDRLLAQLGSIVAHNNETSAFVVNETEQNDAEKIKMLQGQITEKQVNVILQTVYEKKMAEDNQIDDDELRVIYRNLGMERGANEEEKNEIFEAFKNNAAVKQFFGRGDNADFQNSGLGKVLPVFDKRLGEALGAANRQDEWKQLETTKRQIMKATEEGIKPVETVVNTTIVQPQNQEISTEIAGDVFVDKLTTLYETFKTAFGGDGIWQTLSASAEIIVNNLYKAFLEPINELLGRWLLDTKHWQDFAKTVGSYAKTEEQSSATGGAVAPTVAAEKTVERGNQGSKGAEVVQQKSINPVVLIDLSLDSSIAGNAQEIQTAAQNLVKKMEETNKKLGDIANYFKNKTVNNTTVVVQGNKTSNQGTQKNNKTSNQDAQKNNKTENDGKQNNDSLEKVRGDLTKAIISLQGEVKIIADYLEAHDNDGEHDDPSLNFSLQSQPTAR